MTGCRACYSPGDSRSVVSRTVGSVHISCNGEQCSLPVRPDHPEKNQRQGDRSDKRRGKVIQDSGAGHNGA